MASATECSDALLETVPHLMRVIRANVRLQSGPELTMVQFRALAYLGRNAGAMLSEVSGFLGLTLPASSKLMDGLVEAKLVSREMAEGDRRRISLGLTELGQQKYEGFVEAAREFLAGKMRHLNPSERAGVLEAMQTLRSAFADAPAEERQIQPL